MKLENISFRLLAVAALVAATITSCNKYLDIAPPSQITPESYLWEESQLASYAIARYTEILPSHGNWSFGTFGTDGNTDNMVTPTLDNRYIPGQWRVDANGGDWSFTNIYQTNYFLNTVVPRWQNNQVTGNSENIGHYIGEVYFLRAYEYFKKLQALGDFPIVRTVMSDSDPGLLVTASERRPRNEVARFILSDLDSAIMLL